MKIIVLHFFTLTGRRGNRGGKSPRGKSGLRRAACRVTPGESNLKDSVTEKQTAVYQLGVRSEELGVDKTLNKTPNSYLQTPNCQNGKDEKAG